MNLSGVGCGRRGAAQRGEQGTAILFSRQLHQPSIRQSLRVEEEAGPVEQSDDTDGWSAVRGGDLIGERATDTAEPEKDDVGKGRGEGPPAANLRELEHRMNAADGFRNVRLANDERDVALGRSLGDGDDVHAGGRERRERACGNTRGAHHTVAHHGNDGHARPRRHVVDQAARKLAVERMPDRPHRAIGLGLREREPDRAF